MTGANSHADNIMWISERSK